MPKFTHYLLLDQKLRVGRLTAVSPVPIRTAAGHAVLRSRLNQLILPPFTSVFNNYVRTELGYKTDMPYQVFPADQNFFENSWNWGSGITGFRTRPRRCARRS